MMDRAWLLERQRQLQRQLSELQQNAVQPSCSVCSPGDQAHYEAVLLQIERLKHHLAKIERQLN